MDWQRWLGEVFNQHLFDQYLFRLERRFNTAEQIIRHYVRRGPEGTVLDPKFFEDIGIEDEKHRELFEAWFAKECELAAYRTVLESNFAGPRQAMEAYTTPVPGS